MFLEELPEMPPDRDLEFIIDLIPGTAPIVKRPYRMAANELEELKNNYRSYKSKDKLDQTHHPRDHQFCS